MSAETIRLAVRAALDLTEAMTRLGATARPWPLP
jgi:hypothetical protein